MRNRIIEINYDDLITSNLDSGCHGSNSRPSRGAEDEEGEKKLAIVNVRKVKT